MKHRISSKMIAVFAGILFMTVLISWIMNSFFLKDYYRLKKRDAMRTQYEKINEAIMAKATREELSRLFQDIKNTSSIVIVHIWSGGWDYSDDDVAYNDNSMMLYRLQAHVFGQPQIEGEIIYQHAHYRIETFYNEDRKSDYMECYGQFKDGSWFIMSTPLEAINESVGIANQFLLISSSIILVISVMVIMLVSRGISRPILNLANLSGELANLNFDKRYVGREKNEIGVLGTSMNQMADQMEQMITMLKETNSRLQTELDEKIQLDDMRKEFLSNVSHELKTPLALIQGYSEGLKLAVNEDQESREFYCEVIMDETNKMNKLVRKLITLNQIEFGQDALQPERFELTELLRAVLHNSQVLFDHNQIKLEVDLDVLYPVIADEFKIEEVFTNYISNAVNHVDGERTIRVWTEKKDNMVTVFVHNTGQPIPEEDIDKVWIKFYKVDKARTREYGGSGIGLSIVQAIMEAHHGLYSVQNEADGVTFTFSLALAD